MLYISFILVALGAFAFAGFFLVFAIKPELIQRFIHKYIKHF